jgi:hypothetical protein
MEPVTAQVMMTLRLGLDAMGVSLGW